MGPNSFRRGALRGWGEAQEEPWVHNALRAPLWSCSGHLPGHHEVPDPPPLGMAGTGNWKQVGGRSPQGSCASHPDTTHLQAPRTGLRRHEIRDKGRAPPPPARCGLTCCAGLLSSAPDSSFSAGAVNTGVAGWGPGHERPCSPHCCTHSALASPTTHLCHQAPPRSCGCCPLHPQSAPPARSGDGREAGFSPPGTSTGTPAPMGPPPAPAVPGSEWGSRRCC